jgi:hypothetical protein
MTAGGLEFSTSSAVIDVIDRRYSQLEDKAPGSGFFINCIHHTESLSCPQLFKK